MTVTVKLPEELFGTGAEAQRVVPLRMRHVRQIAAKQSGRSVESFDELCDQLAEVWPEWTVTDPETGTPLPQPKDDPSVFMELEMDAFQYFGGAGLTERPTQPRKR